MLQPVVRRTWAPRGQTPVHYSWDRHERISVIGALTLAPNTRRIGVYFTYQYDNVRTENVVFFLKFLHQQLCRPMIVVCDRWSVHRSAVRYLESNHQWLRAEWLPPYAPDLNPVEAMWSYTKHCDLANYIPENASALENAVLDSLAAQHYNQRLKLAYFQRAGLDLL
jgi:transposase